MRSLVALALHPLAHQLAMAANGFRFLPGPALRRFFKGATQLHLAKHALTLQFFLQSAKGLIDVVVANGDLHGKWLPR